jgi:hypothetical protein
MMPPETAAGYAAHLAAERGPMAYLARTPFGDLAPVAEPAVAPVHDAECYICNDPDYAAYGLPLCYPCPICGGHIAADDNVCDVCGWIVA